MRNFIKKNSNVLFIVLLFIICGLSWVFVYYDNAQKDQEYVTLLAEADELFEKKIYDEALDKYKAVLDTNPEVLTAAGKIAYIYYYDEKYDTSVVYCEKILKTDSANPEYRLLEAKALEADGKYKLAVKSLKKARLTTEVDEYLKKLETKFHISYMTLNEVYPWYESSADMYLSSCMEEGKITVYRESGKKLFDGEYSFIGMSSDDEMLFPVCENGEWYYADDSGERRLVPSEPMAYLGRFAGGYAPASDGNSFFYIDKEFNRYLEGLEMAYPFCDGYAIVRSGGAYMTIDTSFNVVNNCEFWQVKEDVYRNAAVNGLVIGMVDDKWCMFTPEGVRMNVFAADDICFPAEQGGIMAYKSGELWGFADSNGIVVIEPLYVEAKSFSKGYAPVKVEDVWGYIDKKGDIVIEPQFADAMPFSDGGKAWVSNSAGYSLLSLYQYE